MRNFEKELLPDPWQEGSKHWIYWNVTRFLLLISLVTMFHFLLPFVLEWILFLEPFKSASDRLAATGIVATLILTFALVSIYRDIGMIQQDQVNEMQSQRDLQEDVVAIQEQQAEIMERQEEWMEIGHRPHVNVERWQFNGNEIPFYLRNVGNGPATYLTARVLLYKDRSFDEQLYEGSIRLSPQDSSSSEIEIGVLPPDGEPISFSGEARFHGVHDNEPVLMTDFPSLASELIESGIESVVYKVFMEYEMIDGKHVREELWAAEAELIHPMELEDLINNMYWQDLDFDYVPPHNLI